MALWCRIKHSQLKNLSNQFKRCYFQTYKPYLVTNHAISHTRICGVTEKDSILQSAQFEFCKHVRSFAVPAQFKPKQEEEDEGPRLNEKITAQYIRLVLDEGHEVVSRREALERAKNLKLDLVEVDRKAKPPVCKIMDYHREQYLQRLKSKERAKSKSEGSLRTGECKSVQFEGKIEQKDLQMKAATVKRMMDSGYRVKCIARVNDKKTAANEDLPGLLARFCTMIEDVSVIESGPIMEKKGAYVIVRHVKYGLPKKGSKKMALVNKLVEKDSESETDTNPVNESPLMDDAVPTSHWPENPLEIGNRYKKDPISRTPPSTEMNIASPLPETENRYKKDPRKSSPAETNFPNLNPRRLQPQYPDHGRQPQQYPNQGRPAQPYPSQGRPTQQYPTHGRPVQFDPSTRPQSREPMQGQIDRNSRIPAEQSPNYSAQRRGELNVPESNSISEPQPTEVNRYKKAVNRNSQVPNFHGSRGQGR